MFSLLAIIVRGLFEIAIFYLSLLILLYGIYFILELAGIGFAHYVKMVIDKIRPKKLIRKLKQIINR